MSQNHFLEDSTKDLQHTIDDTSRKMLEDRVALQAKDLGLPYVNLAGFPVDLNVLGLFSQHEAELAESLPFFREGHDLRIATANPKNKVLQDFVHRLSEKYKISLYLISITSFKQTLILYKKIVQPKSVYHEQIQIEKKEPFADIAARIKNEEGAAQTTATQLLTDLLALAVTAGASDIHLEPEADFMKVRLRIDGVLQDVTHLTKVQQKQVVTRIKVLSKLKINVEDQPQDGRLSFISEREPIDVRVSILPGGFGEGLVLRLLGIGAYDLKLIDLGMRKEALEKVRDILHKPNGMIITTGPTGSGKTTTLYAFLNELNEPGVKIITLEDPIEYKLSGVQQTPIDHNAGFTFAKGLRAVLRQDPDIVMVGEIRDQETAETALQAALTGHIVLSTLHTNDAAGTIPRLITMDVKPFVIAPALNAAMAQRLVRRICEVCKTEAKLSDVLATKVNQILDAIPKSAGVEMPAQRTFYHSPGCAACSNLGYKGRIGIYEVLHVTDAIQELILKEAPALTIKREAVKNGMITMVQDGLLKALEGITDVEEVFRVAGD
jgi:type IV pilus assembly protein PilB